MTSATVPTMTGGAPRGRRRACAVAVLATLTVLGSSARAQEPVSPADAAQERPLPGPADVGSPVAVPEQAAEDPVEDPTDGPPTAPVVIEADEPPVQWTDWDVEGNLLEPKATARALLDSTMKHKQSLTRQARADIAEFARSIGYRLIDIEPRPHPRGGTLAVLVLEPVTLVRRIDVDIDNQRLDLLYGRTVFEEEIARRMRLRRGAAMEPEGEARAAQLAGEAERLTEYLRDQGFFEARTLIRAVPDGRHAVRLDVDIRKGPQYTVGEIRVVGNDAVRTEEIVARFRHDLSCLLVFCWGEKAFSRTQLSADVEAVVQLYQKRGYPGVRVRTDFDPRRSFHRDRKKVTFNVFVNERRKLDVIFEGNDRLDDEALRELLTFDEEGSYDDVEIAASAESIRRAYQARGYFETSVTWVREPFDFLEQVIYTIEEGPQLKVREVNFQGNDALSDERLASEVKTRVFRSLPIFGSGGFVTTVQLTQDVERIRAVYREEGFADAQVRARVVRDKRVAGNAAALAATIASNLAADDLYVRFVIDEGPRDVVEAVDVRFEGPHELDAQAIRAATGLRAGQPFHESLLPELRTRLKRFYFERGRPHADPQPSARESGPNRVVVVLDIKENREVVFGKVAIRGNFKTSAWVIRDELGYDEGSPMTLSRAERGQQNVRATGLFEAVRVAFVDFDRKSENVVHTVVQVEERYDQRLAGEVGGGISSDAGAFVEGAVITPNLLGIGLSNDLRGNYGQEFQSIENKLVAPRWIARRLVGATFKTELAGFFRSESTERFESLRSLGASLALSKAGRHGFFRGWLATLRYDFRRRTREEELVRPAGASDDITRSPVSTRTGAIGASLLIDKREDARGVPNPLVPERGFKLELRTSFADRVLGGQNRFIKVGVSGQHFLRLSGRLQIANSVRYDHGIPMGGEVLLPEVERYFAGGDTTVRGFEEDRLATEIIEEPLSPLTGVTKLRVLPAGGNVRVIHNLDLQVRVWSVYDIPVTSAIFFDSGLVTNSLDDRELDDLRHAVGVALFRLVAPFGSLSVEYAIPLDPRPGDNPRGRFHFNFGLLF